MGRVGRTGKLLFTCGAGLFVVAMLAGAAQSWRVERRLPVIDLFVSGPKAHIETLLARKDYDGAIKELQIQARLLPFDAATLEHLGSLLAIQGRQREARLQFQQLVRLRPDYAAGYAYLGSTYLDSGQAALAARNFEQAIRLDPKFASAHNNLGVALIQLGELAEAAKCFARAVELAPDYKDARANLVRARQDLKLRP